MIARPDAEKRDAEDRVAAPKPSPVTDAAGVDAETCLAFFRRLAAGVTLVTSRDTAGPVGLTASTVTSVSLRPPMLLACLAGGSRTLAAICARGAFAVQLLREDQRRHSAAFAVAGAGRDKFAGVDTVDVLGIPILTDSLAWSVCVLERQLTAGDHVIVVGRILLAGSGSGVPLLWHASSYHQLVPSPWVGNRSEGDHR